MSEGMPDKDKKALDDSSEMKSEMVNTAAMDAFNKQMLKATYGEKANDSRSAEQAQQGYNREQNTNPGDKPKKHLNRLHPLSQKTGGIGGSR